MIEIVDGSPSVAVDPAEYVRLLGFPRGHQLEGRAGELAEWACAWYADHGRPWIYARSAPRVSVIGGEVRVGSASFHSTRLEQMWRDAEAHDAVLVAVSAGSELERAAHDAWLAERPDEYFFLEMYGSAVVEYLTTSVGARLCAWADAEGLAVLPHYSPGYPEWDIADQAALLSQFEGGDWPGAIDVLESGMLRPRKSLLAVFGLTRHVEHVRPLSGLVPCAQCSFGPCQFRRSPYARAGSSERTGRMPNPPDAGYRTSVRALRRWVHERLTLTAHDDGSTTATFRYEGSTCSNMGRPLHFDYVVELGPRGDGFRIRAQTCVPAADSDDYQSMCRYTREGRPFVDRIASEAPLVGRPLGDVLGWQRPELGAGCFCESGSREHKWGLVLETIHYALTQGKSE